MKQLAIISAIVLSLFVSACGTILKPNQINKPHSSQLDIAIVALDAFGLIFFIIPGAVAFVVDYSNGTLYLPRHTLRLNDTSDEGVQKVLVKNGYNVNLADIQEAKNKK